MKLFFVHSLALLVGLNGLAVPALTLDEIQLWAGAGTNRGGMVVHWSAPEVRDASTGVPNPITDKSMAWGFRWNNRATAEEMFNAVLAADPHLFAVVNVVSAQRKAIYGLGYDYNNNRVFGVWNSTNLLPPDLFTNGLVVASYLDCDTLEPLDPTDLYWGGWYGPNWELWHELGGVGGFMSVPNRGKNEFWSPDDPENPYYGRHGQWEYLNVGLSGLELKDGSWVGWSVAPGGLDYSWIL